MEPSVEELAVRLEDSDAAVRDAAFDSLVSGLTRDPDAWARAAGGVIDRWLDAGERRDDLDRLLGELQMATEGSSTVIPVEPLCRVIAEGMEGAGNYGVVMAALLLVRQDPVQGILVKGVDHTLIASEQTLIQAEEMRDQNDGHLSRWLREIVEGLWSTVARHDPATIIALLEVWLQSAGWQSRLGAILIRHAVEAAKSNLWLLPDTLHLLKIYEGASEENSGSEEGKSWVEPASTYLEALRESEGEWLIRRLAMEVASGLDPTTFRGAPIEPPEPAAFEPDPHADKVLMAVLDDDEMVQWAARDELDALFTHPTSATIQAACEIVDVLLERRVNDSRAGQLINLMCIGLTTRACLVPVEALERWVAKDSGLDDFSRGQCFALMAAARPDRIVDDHLGEAISLHAQFDFWSFWKNLGSAYPGLIEQFADAWFDRVGTQPLSIGDLGSHLLKAIPAVAMARPEEVERLMAAVEKHQRANAESNEDPARADEFSRTLEKLREIEAGI